MKRKLLYLPIHVEVELRKIKNLVLLFLILSSPIKTLKAQANNELTIDTICGMFYFENLVEDYIIEDAIIKFGGFIQYSDSISSKNYENEYLIFDSDIPTTYKQYFNKSTNNLKADLKSQNIYEETDINPFCGVYYKLLYLKVIVLRMSEANELIPSLVKCDSNAKSAEKGVERNVEKSVILNVLDYKIIDG
jgi:hypothetical protein